MDPFSYTTLSQASYIESLFAQYKEDPASVHESWRHFFEGMAFTEGKESHGPSPADAYRRYGHLRAQCNPIQVGPLPDVPELDVEMSADERARYEAIYCGTIGYEYMGLDTFPFESFLQERIEGEWALSPEERKRILHDLNRSEIFESFIHMKYPGQKRFSIEGGETLIPMLHTLLEEGAKNGASEVVLGMSHRGRINVLTNILGKSYAAIFREFEGTFIPQTFQGSGDVKYHKGYSSDIETPHGSIHVALAANPSHLESVNPIVEGKARAKQELKEEKVIPILVHGDAALAGQGVVYETMQLSRLEGYTTGGTINIIVNNRVGFTARPEETKSTRYCSDLAKTFGAPVFHLNAEDPDGCIRITKLALEVREAFGCDVFIELNCYRKYGHNEGDEPGFTQPRIYKLISEKRIIRDIYRDKLVEEGIINAKEVETLQEEFRQVLTQAIEETKEHETPLEPPPPEEICADIETGVSKEELRTLAHSICTLPEGLHVHPKLRRIYNERLKMVEGEKTLDWGMAEALAMGSLLKNGTPIRLSGQDSIRGTFSHRHAAVVDQETEERYFPLRHIAQDQAPFHAYNSPLSEFAVLGFEYGYSLSAPDSLVLWEAQFGDFANGAQVIIDQYIATAEEKWGRKSNLTLLLPHGYEGMGPEHSSARIERFLQLAGDENMSIVIPTTPAQYFHILRRQALCTSRKPLIIFTPKALLRYHPSLSSLADLSSARFSEVILDGSSKRLFLCSGKIYYDLIAEREKRGADVSIVRIEQLYPFPEKAVAKAMEGREEIVWVQEEHSNMGAWEYVRPYLGAHVRYAGRDRSASPATGSVALHKKQLTTLLDEAFHER